MDNKIIENKKEENKLIQCDKCKRFVDKVNRLSIKTLFSQKFVSWCDDCIIKHNNNINNRLK